MMTQVIVTQSSRDFADQLKQASAEGWRCVSADVGMVPGSALFMAVIEREDNPVTMKNLIERISMLEKELRELRELCDGEDITKANVCPKCDGYGMDEHFQRCPECFGTGEVDRRQDEADVF